MIKYLKTIITKKLIISTLIISANHKNSYLKANTANLNKKYAYNKTIYYDYIK